VPFAVIFIAVALGLVRHVHGSAHGGELAGRQTRLVEDGAQSQLPELVNQG
jgi:hypothetical protein